VALFLFFFRPPVKATIIVKSAAIIMLTDDLKLARYKAKPAKRVLKE
jgi:hypothetical protein